MQKHSYSNNDDTIIAPATAQGTGAIAVIRVSGKDAFALTNKFFKGKDLTQQKSHTIHFGTIRDGERIVDEVLISLFKGPHSFTKEDVIEISCHGSPYIVKEIIQIFIKAGARHAQPGEFTKRAFLNGQFDLAQAEAVADVIAAESEAAHRTALNQMRGGFSGKIKVLRENLIHFASMIELELDFSEEDVEFASRDGLKKLIRKLEMEIYPLIESFSAGNAIKNGVPVVIAGRPNAGKSTLLNALLNEERAIVSDIAGTTRDTIEEVLYLNGIAFRFIDTAGIRNSEDVIEKKGIEKTLQKVNEAFVVIYLYDCVETSAAEVKEDIQKLTREGTHLIVVANKIDKIRSLHDNIMERAMNEIAKEYLVLSCSSGEGLDILKQNLLNTIQLGNASDTLVTNVRHYQALLNTKEALEKVTNGIELKVTSDFLAEDIRTALYHLGEITGEITNEDLLGTIFSKFCIGK